MNDHIEYIYYIYEDCNRNSVRLIDAIIACRYARNPVNYGLYKWFRKNILGE